MKNLSILMLLALSSASYAQTPEQTADPIPDAELRGALPEAPVKYGKFDGTFDCEKFRTKNIGCDPETVVKNCQALDAKIPIKEALHYTLQYFYENHGELRDPTCALASDIMETNLFTEDEVKKGITSPRFMVRDMATVKASQVDSYLVDLCNGDFKKFQSYIGTGSSREGKGLKDVDDKHTSLAGAFLTDDKTTRLVPLSPSAYRQIMNKYGDKTRVYLIGLNSSNNSTVLSKPMHITPYTSSWGCPSVSAKDADVLTMIAKEGKKSLMMTYDKDSMQKLGDEAVCKNGEGRAEYRTADKPRASGNRNRSSSQRRNRGRR